MNHKRSRALLLCFGWMVLAAALRPTISGQDPATGQPAPRHVGPPALYPNPDVTPGKADTVSAEDLTGRWQCPTSIHKVDCTYSQAHRRVSQKTHTKVYDLYQVPAAKRKGKHGEVDHFMPLCAGGSNDLTNLWYQPAKNKWDGKNFGYHEKDYLESWVCAQIKAGKLDPKEAFARITSDWVKYYMEVNPKRVRFSD